MIIIFINIIHIQYYYTILPFFFFFIYNISIDFIVIYRILCDLCVNLYGRQSDHPLQGCADNLLSVPTLRSADRLWFLLEVL